MAEPLDWQEREERLLSHLALYRLSFTPIIERVVFQGGSWENVRRRLMERPDPIITSAALGGSPIRYYQLSGSELSRRSLPRTHTDLQGQTLSESIAVLWYCAVGKANRYRLTAAELGRFFPEETPTGVHSLERGSFPKGYRFQRLIVPGQRTPAARIAFGLAERIEEALARKLTRSAIESGSYGFVVLTERSDTDRLKAAIERRRLEDLAPVRVAYAPTRLTIARAFHELKQKPRTDS